jgi:FkbM family methyltransferase
LCEGVEREWTKLERQVRENERKRAKAVLFFHSHASPLVTWTCFNIVSYCASPIIHRGMSANAEDIVIYDTFFKSIEFTANKTHTHTYMEIGGHDGVRESNSRLYDVCLGWNGLLVEPHPKNYERMVQLRPNAHHLGIAPSCMANATGTVLFPEHMYTNAVANEKGNSIEIHCGPLQHYLDALKIRHIDFWSLDVEGAELKVLETVDFDRTNIDVIIVESANRLSNLPEIQQKVNDVRLLLRGKGYLMLASVLVPKSDVFLHKRACRRHSNIAECNGQSGK